MANSNTGGAAGNSFGATPSEGLVNEHEAAVDSLCIGRKLDIFSREARPGCEQFGNEPGKFEGAA